MNPVRRLVEALVGFSMICRSIERWARLSSREKVMVSGLFLFMVAVIFCSLVLFPGVKRLTSAIDSLHSSRELNYYVMGRLAGLTSLNASERERPSVSVQELVIQSAKSTGIEIERYELERNGYFSVDVSRVEFSKFIKWVALLESKEVQLASFNLARLDSGVVSGSLSVKYISFP